jgi:hypothetical protein
MKRLNILFILALSSLIAFAQKDKEKEKPDHSEKFKKLESYYSEGKYADCIFNAEKLMDNEKYSKDPEIYLYSSMSYLGIYKNPSDYPEKKYPDFKNPLKTALADFVRLKKYDKSGEVVAAHQDFANELKTTVAEAAGHMYEKKDVMKLSSFTRDIIKAYDKDESMLMMSGGYLIATNNLGDGIKAADTAVALIKKRAAATYTDLEKQIMAKGFIFYTDYLLSRQEVAKAIDVISVALNTMPNDDSIKKQAEKVNATPAPATNKPAPKR